MVVDFFPVVPTGPVQQIGKPELDPLKAGRGDGGEFGVERVRRGADRDGGVAGGDCGEGGAEGHCVGGGKGLLGGE